MADLDKMLLPAFRRADFLPKDLARDVMRVEKALLKSTPLAGIMTGQLLYYMIHKYIKTMPQHACQLSVGQLWVIEWSGDKPDQMKSFLARWDYILDEMNPAEVPSNATLTDLFADQVKKSKVLEHDCQTYRRFDRGDDRKSHQWLRGRTEVYLGRAVREQQTCYGEGS